MTTSADEPDEPGGPGDDLAVLLRPAPLRLPPPAGEFGRIRRRALRRKVLRTAAGGVVALGFATAVALPSLMTARPHEVPPAAPPAATLSPTPPPPTPRPPARTGPSPSAVPTPSRARAVVHPTRTLPTAPRRGL